MQEIIEKLKKLDLAFYPENEIKNLLSSLGPIAFMETIYEYPKLIERAVPNNENEQVFNSKSRISFKPQEYNTTYQRASTPNNTMFYGSVIPQNISKSEIDNARIIGISETCDLLRDKTILEGERLITFGKWEVQEQLSLLTIIEPDKQYNIKFLNDLGSDYRKSLAQCPHYIIKKTKDFLCFFASEFSKPVQNGEDYNYMISAIFTEIITQGAFDGILYPSVQADGYGLCVAIHPSSMHKLTLVKVLQSKLVKKDRKIDMDNIRFCIVEPGSSEFHLEDINDI